MFTKKAFVLFSGGLDSTTALYAAKEAFGAENVEAVSCDYGQRHSKEIEYAKRTCDKLKVKHTCVSLGSLLSGGGIMLTDASVQVPDISYADIRGVSPTYVPYRNGTMLSVIAAHAQKEVMRQIDYVVDYWSKKETNPFMLSREDIQHLRQEATKDAQDLVTIYAGQHAEDAANWAYPDCTFEFLGAQANAIYMGTYRTVRLCTPFVFSTKAMIVTIGHKLGVPYEDSWSCYKGEELHCGICPTCRSRREAFQHAGYRDPTIYANKIGYDEQV